MDGTVDGADHDDGRVDDGHDERGGVEVEALVEQHDLGEREADGERDAEPGEERGPGAVFDAARHGLGPHLRDGARHAGEDDKPDATARRLVREHGRDEEGAAQPLHRGAHHEDRVEQVDKHLVRREVLAVVVARNEHHGHAGQDHPAETNTQA
jgi:hypothetical protein